MVNLINKVNNVIDDQLHITQFKVKTNKLYGFKAIGSNTTSNQFCIKMNDPTKKIKINNKDLENNINLKNYVLICKANPWTNFALWTKRKDLIQKFFDKHKKPKNLILIYSNPAVDKPIKKTFGYFDKIFNNVSADKFTDIQNCTGQQCINCLRCYNKSSKNADNIIIEKVRNVKNAPNHICKACYSHKGINFRAHTMVKPLQKNSDLLSKDILKPIQIPRIIDRFFRFNHHGELIT